jgi:hypothetical protein
MAREPYGSCIDKPPSILMLELENLLISLAMPDESSLFWVLST